MEVRVCGWRTELKITEKWNGWEERVEKQRNREKLEKLIQEVEGWIKGKIEECRERRKRGKERLKEWRTKGEKEREEEVRRGKRELRRKIKTAKGDHWKKFLGEMGVNDKFTGN
ncbi:hypothetical protein C7212DRAFT_303830 [Tuber magnatum]|uniref:Uncharacterized protein n=1 Tax=Tuber magnatum TaxID=42249 RepID=A0A317SXX0_9PEZI|nr:hypothetical protein C7212DRAFT_303830 [Tuber magnatum]